MLFVVWSHHCQQFPFLSIPDLSCFSRSCLNNEPLHIIRLADCSVLNFGEWVIETEARRDNTFLRFFIPG